ncbi:hypothetical protein NDU88_004919 [Pleurodeles waltl]|uniref:Uncharacterized protein n=1 Tax=Pleurodeles waltl TaxID=8319 RepID=A0AAV7M9R4_PLEWA|nr:hypothetical protein NDU88_004919 [Pleurodeles waltl]
MEKISVRCVASRTVLRCSVMGSIESMWSEICLVKEVKLDHLTRVLRDTCLAFCNEKDLCLYQLPTWLSVCPMISEAVPGSHDISIVQDVYHVPLCGEPGVLHVLPVQYPVVPNKCKYMGLVKQCTK